MKYLLSFAQEYEDIIIYHMLRDVQDTIHWIDVGANDPIYISVTKFFSNLGGRGINIEPLEHEFKRLVMDRPDDINLNIGISNQEGELKLYGAGTAASFDSNNQWVKDAGYSIVSVRTLTQVCEKYVKQGESIHFLKIDVEGWERECLEGMDLVQYRPWIICMESTEPGTDIPCWEQWESILLDNHYIFAGMNGINRYYVAEEHKQLVQEFCKEEELNKLYALYKYSDFASIYKQYKQVMQENEEKETQKKDILDLLEEISRSTWQRNTLNWAQFVKLRLARAYCIVGQPERALPLLQQIDWTLTDGCDVKYYISLIRKLAGRGIDVGALLDACWKSIHTPIPSAERARERVAAFRELVSVEDANPAPSMENTAQEELARLAEKVKEILARYPADDPAILELKNSEAYRKVAHLIEG